MLGRVHKHAVVGMGLDVLLQILRTLEGLTTEVALMRLEWYVDTNMRRDVVALHGGGSACAPLAGKIEVVCALAADMTLANVVIECFSAVASLAAALPLAGQVVDGRALRSCWCLDGRRRLRSGLLGLLRGLLHCLRDRLRCGAVHDHMEMEMAMLGE